MIVLSLPSYQIVLMIVAAYALAVGVTLTLDDYFIYVVTIGAIFATLADGSGRGRAPRQWQRPSWKA